MSALRKLRQARLALQQQEQQGAGAAALDAADAEDDKDDVAAERQQRANVMQAAFSLLQEDDEEEPEEEEAEQPSSALREQPAQPAVSTSESGRPAAAASSDEVSEADSADEDKPNARRRSRNSTRRPAKPAAKGSRQQQPAQSRGKQRRKEAEPAEDEKAEEAEEDIDSLLAELDQQPSNDSAKRATGSKRAVSNDEADSSDWSFLATQQKHLDANSEIRARFGSSAVRGVAAAETEGEEKVPRGMIRRRPQGAAVKALARRQRLVKIGDDWPPMVDRGDLKMVRIDPASSSSTPNARGLSPVNAPPASLPPSRGVWLLTSFTCPLFSFRYSSDYDRLQQEYLSAISSHDIQAVLYFARQHPYHVDCCVQLSELSESQGEFVVAHAAIQRALHMYDLSLYRDFDLFSGRCRLDGEVRENRGFFVALARHAQMLGKKGYSRTALEVCKLLLSLSPLMDPQCVALYIDYHAIRAHQYAWLLDLPHHLDAAVAQMTRAQPPWPVRKAGEQPAVVKEESKEEKEKVVPIAPRVPAVVLPNLCYARAMAAHLIEQQERKDQPEEALQPSVSPPSLSFLVSSSSSSPSSASASSTATSTSSTSLLHLAVLLYPEVVTPLLRLSGHEGAVDSGEWKPLLARLSKLYPESKYVDKLVLVYTERSGSLWKNDALIASLLRVCQHIVRTLDTGSQSLAAFQQLRAGLFPRNLAVPPALSQLQRTQFTDTVHRLPPEVLMAQAQAQAEGGLMLDDEEDGGGVARMSLAELRAALQANGMEGLNVQGDNPLVALLRTLLPWNVVAPQMQQRQQQQQQEADGDVAGQQNLLEEVDEDEGEYEDEGDEEEEEEDLGEY